MKYSFSGLLILLLFSCASVNVNYDYDSQVDFSKYKTYNYYADMETGLSALDTKRLLDILDEMMASKGLVLAENSDFFVNIQSEEYQNNQRNAVGVGIGGGGRNVGGGISVGIPVGQSGLNRQLVFDFVDNDTGLFWQAVAESSYNPNASPEKREANLRAIVSKVLAGYPTK